MISELPDESTTPVSDRFASSDASILVQVLAQTTTVALAGYRLPDIDDDCFSYPFRNESLHGHRRISSFEPARDAPFEEEGRIDRGTNDNVDPGAIRNLDEW